MLTYTFITPDGYSIRAYYYDDRYRYTRNTDKGIEYREVVSELISSDYELQRLLLQDIHNHPYDQQQFSCKCIRCSKPYGAPRKEYNLAPICNRCYNAMLESTDTISTPGIVFYEINADGSKGNVLK